MHIVSEQLGPSLRQYALDCRRTLSRRDLAVIARDALLCLRALHALGLAHCDVQPANLLLRREKSWNVKLGGLARAVAFTELARADDSRQETAYRAPEVALGGAAGAGVDVWSLGCALYELAARRPLFAYEHSAANLAKAIALNGGAVPAQAKRRALLAGCLPYAQSDGGLFRVCVPKRAAAVSDELLAETAEPVLADFVAKCLEIEPARRITIEQALEHAFVKNG